MPPAQVNLLNCLILQSKIALKYIPSHYLIYFINSKRRFFLYFKSHRQMIEAMRVFAENNIKFYRRDSLLPDREELEEQVYHCCYRYKKMDLRRNLLPSTPYNQPKLHFDKYQRVKSNYQTARYEEEAKKVEVAPPQPSMPQLQQKKPQKQPQKPQEFSYNGCTIKDQSVIAILQNKQLLNQILFSLNFDP